MSSFDAVLALFFRFYGNSEDGDAFFNSIRTLFLSFNTLMDRPLDEGVKIKVSWRKIVSSSCFLIYLFHFILLVKSVCSYQAFVSASWEPLIQTTSHSTLTVLCYQNIKLKLEDALLALTGTVRRRVNLLCTRLWLWRYQSRADSNNDPDII